jgi:hypothetical protein
LEAFAAEMFAPLARADQRDKGGTYLRGLLLPRSAADGHMSGVGPVSLLVSELGVG